MQKSPNNKVKGERYNTFLDIITEDEDINSKNHISKNAILRLYLLLITTLCCYFVIIFRIIDVALTEVDEKKFFYLGDNANSISADILDRNGVILATSLPTSSLYAKPDQIMNVEKTAKIVTGIIAQHGVNKSYQDTFQKVLSKLKSQKNFVWLKRHLLPDEYLKIQKLGIPGLYFLMIIKDFIHMKILLLT